MRTCLRTCVRACVRASERLVKGFAGWEARGTREMWLSQSVSKPGQQHGRRGQRGQKGGERGRERRALSPWRGLRGLGSQEDGDWRGGARGAGPQGKDRARWGRRVPGRRPDEHSGHEGTSTHGRRPLGRPWRSEMRAGEPDGGGGRPCTLHPVLNCDFGSTGSSPPFS